MSRNGQAPAPGAFPAPQPQYQTPYAPQYPQAPVPYGYAQPLPPAYPPQHLPPGPPPLEQIILRECEHCGKHIRPGEESVELFEGIEGRSLQTGYAITVDYPNDAKSKGLVVLHRGSCSMEYMMQEVCPEEADEAIFEMANEQADANIDEFLRNWGINSWDQFEHALRTAGYRPEDDDMEQQYRDRVNGED